jgi:hypothetical protein
MATRILPLELIDNRIANMDSDEGNKREGTLRGFDVSVVVSCRDVCTVCNACQRREETISMHELR